MSNQMIISVETGKAEKDKNETNKQNNNNSLDSLVGLFQAGHEDVW